MARLRLTLLVRGLDGVEARYRATTARQKQRVLQVMLDSGERVFDHVVADCPVDEGLMVGATRLIPTREGYHYAVGWLRKDIVGKRRPKSKTLVKSFYPVFVIRGTRRRAGNDILTAAELRERPIRRRLLKAALAPR